MTSPYQRRKQSLTWGPSDLPARTFFYDPVQIASLLSVAEDTVRRWLHYEGRSSGLQPKDKLKAVNVAPAEEQPVWRIPEEDLLRWLRYKRVRIYKYVVDREPRVDEEDHTDD